MVALRGLKTAIIAAPITRYPIIKITKMKILAVLLTLILSAPFSFIRAQSDINLTGYTQTFDEEFNSLSATTANPKGSSIWFVGPANGSTGDFSASKWNINSFGVSNGILSDQAWYSSGWQSGLLSSVDPSKTGFTQQYGYFEIRCQMPNAGEGAWPAFWLDTTSGISHGQNEEIDIFEWYGVTNTPGKYQDFVQQASHNWNANGSHASGDLYSPETKMPNGAYPWQGYHIYGCQVDPVHITWYIDGVETNQIATPTSYLNSPFYLMVDYALGGGWPLSGSPFTTTGSSSLLVDWVRVYALPTSSTSSSTDGYNDNFTRTGALTGSEPDVADTNGNKWAETYYGNLGGNSLAPNGTKLPSASGNIDGGVLPVNGTSGVTLDGTKDFTLSANFVTGTSYNSAVLSLGTSLNGVAALKLNSGISTSADAYGNGSVVGLGNKNYNGTQINTLTMSYRAATGLITFEVNGSPISVYQDGNTLAVTPAQLKALAYVGFEFEYSGANNASMDNFTLAFPPPAASYNDNFTRTGALTGSEPDAADTNGNKWAETYYGNLGGNSLAPNGTDLPSASGNIDGGVLPVNGTSGVTLDGTKDFTLSANFVTGTSYNSAVLSLGTSLNGLAALKLNSGSLTSADAYGKGSVVGFGNKNYNGTQSNTLTMSYSAATGLITFEVNGSPINVYQGGNTLAVTHAQIQSLSYVGFEFEYSGVNNASMDNFNLTVQ
jgi:hypothetical protein